MTDRAPQYTELPSGEIVDAAAPAAPDAARSSTGGYGPGRFIHEQREQLNIEARAIDGDDGAEGEEETKEHESGLAWEDEWDKPGAKNPDTGGPPDENADPFEKYRGRKGHVLAAPEYGYALDDAAIADFGKAAAHAGIDAGTAQRLVDAFAMGGSKEPAPTEYDPQRTVTELRFEWGEHLEPTLARINEFVSQQPALVAFLDSTGLGNSPTVLRLLAGASAGLLDRAEAEAFIARVNKDPNHPYWQGDKVALALVRVAYIATS
jgi:hypothetical protein